MFSAAYERTEAPADESMLHNVLEAAVDGVVSINAQGQVVFFNRAAERLLGYSTSEMLGENVSRLILGHDANQHQSYVDRYLRDGNPRIIGIGREVEVVRKDGRLLPVWLSICETQRDGQRFFTAFMHDLTLQRELERRTAQRAAITAQNPHPVICTTIQGDVAYANSAGEELLRRSGSDDGRKLPESLTEIVRCTMLLSEIPTLRLTDGEKTFALQICPHPQQQYANIFGHDITPLLLVENLLRENEERLSAILLSAADGIVLVDGEGKVNSVNPAGERILGTSSAQLRGRLLSQFLSTPSGDLLADLENCVHHLDRTLSQARVARESEPPIEVEYAASVVHHGAGRGFTIVMRDVTDRKRLEAEREQLQEQLVDAARQAGQSEVASGVLHSVGNVLNSVITTVSTLQEKLAQSEVPWLVRSLNLLEEHWSGLTHFLTADVAGQALRAYLPQALVQIRKEQAMYKKEIGTISQHLDHLQRVIIAQQGHARRAKVMAETNLSDVCNDALQLVTAMRSLQGITLDRDYSASLVCHTDRHLVVQIAVNLLSNAVDALHASERDDKRLLVAIRIDFDVIRISVADNGIGVHDSDRARIFSYGYTTKPTGHGFGLHSAALAAKRLGGDLILEDSLPGLGAKFTLTLPRDEPCMRSGT